MTEPLTDDRLAEMREEATYFAKHYGIARVEAAGRDWLAVLDELASLRAKNAELVAARAELVEGLRAFGPPCDTEDWPDGVELIYEQGAQAERLICTLGEMRRAAELVARHSP